MAEGKHADHFPQQLTTVTLTPKQFETLYLQPRSAAGKSTVAGGLGNPTPIGISSLILALLPLSMDLMDFRGASVASAITMLGGFYGVGGIGLYISGIMEWIIGNTFPSVVFTALGGLFISYAIILQPSFDIAASFATAEESTSGATAIAAGSATVAYNSGLALYFLTWGLVAFVLFVCSLRTNVAFACLIAAITIVFELLAAGYFHLGHGNAAQALRELKAAGAFGFVTSICAIWIDVSLLFKAVGFPFNIPLFDLSSVGHKEENGPEQV